MTSKKQIAANRANAQKSTGATSDAGKAITRLNAVRDNITGQITTLSEPDRLVFETLKAEHLADLAPETVCELKLANAIAWDTWRLDRLRAAEMNIFARAADFTESDNNANEPDLQTAIADTETFLTQAKRFELMSLYEQRMTRALHRNRAALQELQDARRQSYYCNKQEEILLARFQELKDLPYQAPAEPSPNGWVFSSEEITLAAARQRHLEAAQYILNLKAPWVKYGSTGSGSPDLFAELPYRTPPDCIPPKIHGVSPESIALRKFYHPEEFTGKRRK